MTELLVSFYCQSQSYFSFFFQSNKVTNSVSFSALVDVNVPPAEVKEEEEKEEVEMKEMENSIASC